MSLMKRKTIIITAILIFALSACGKVDETSSADTTQVYTTTEQTTQEAIDTTSSEAPEDTSDQAIVLELKETDNPYISEPLNMSGTYTDSVGNTADYQYQLPQFNADSESASSLNKRIEADLYELIETEVMNMEGGYSLISYRITYEVAQYGEIVAIIVTVPYPNDCKDYYAYTYDFKNNKELSNADLLAMNEMTEDAFVKQAVALEEEYFTELVNEVGITDQEMISYQLNEAKEATSANLPMYYDENGVLNVYVPFPSIAGASFYYHLCQF